MCNSVKLIKVLMVCKKKILKKIAFLKIVDLKVCGIETLSKTIVPSLKVYSCTKKFILLGCHTEIAIFA